jgi:elongation factor P
MKTNAGNLKKGDFINYQNDIWQVIKSEFYSPGKGSALMKTKIKSQKTGKVIDVTFKSNETVETLPVEIREMVFLYKDGENLYFMDERSFEQFTLSQAVVGSIADFLKENSKMYTLVFEDKIINIRPPMSVVLQITQTEEAIKGDTVTGAKKPAIVETGAKVMVPLFIKKDDFISINPETGEYTGKVNQ